MFMASAGRRVGSFPVLLLRSILATAFLVAVVGGAWLLSLPQAFPDLRQTFWIAVSGVVGVGVGDVLIYEAFVVLGPRRTTQTLVLAPAVTVLVAWVALGESLTPEKLYGIAVILAGTSYAVFAGNRRRVAPAEQVVAAGESGDVESAAPVAPPPARVEPGRATPSAFLLAIGGAVCMAVGAVMARHAFNTGRSPDALPATLVRVGSATVLLWIMPVLRGQARPTLSLLRDRWVARRIAAGVAMGPLLGMLCYLGALKQSPAGLVSTLVATSPLFAIPLTVLRYRVRIGWDVVLAACIATAGVGMLFFA